MRLSELSEARPGTALEGGEIELRGLSADSRSVGPGFLFAALNGSQRRGSDFIADAVRRGAVALLTPPDASIPASARALPRIVDANPRRRLALMAARFYGRQPRTIAAVTGTNGKSSVAGFTRQIWLRCGFKAASLGTLGLEAPGIDLDLGHTTPDPVRLHEALADLTERGVDHLALEASSHGLDQCRLDGVQIRAAAFTNLSRDHFDYHADAGAYLAAKVRLFDTVMGEGGIAVLNADVPEFDALAKVCRARRHRIVSYGHNGRDLRLITARPEGTGQIVELAVDGMPHTLRLALAGTFQAHNLLAALGLALAGGAPLAGALAALPHVAGIRGRLEAVGGHPRDALVYVDYAHTPDALRCVLEALRPYAKARLVALFGCGGDRDRGKRPQMGAIASRLADAVIVTDDNPRGEDAAAIRAEILSACPNAREIAERQRAIHDAIAGLAPGDVLLIAGKGHESGQILSDRTIPFDDAAEARKAMAALQGGVA